MLTHGTTLHGIQNLEPGLETVPTSYYARRSGVGLALANADALYGARPRIGVVGLGSGTLVLLRAAEPGLDLLRDRPGDGPGRAQPLHLPLAAARRRPGSCSATRA